ncbi:MAG: alpha/beta fold hydrolase [Anaerolineae bacterium]
MPTTRANGIELYYELHGQPGGDAVVLIGGLAGDCRAWAPQLPALTQEYSVLAFDNRGTGRSEAPPGPYTTELFARDTAALMEAVDIQRAHIIGRSMGGAIAQQLAIHFPQRCRTITIAASFGKMDPYGARILENWRGVVQRLGWREAARHQVLFFFPPDFFNSHPEVIAQAEEALDQKDRPPDAYVASSIACTEHDTLAELHRIACPALVLAGGEDTLCSVECSRQLAELIPQAELVVFEGTSHFFLLQKPEESLEVILGFLRAH